VNSKFWLILFWISLPFIAVIILRIISMERKIQERKKQIQRDLHSPGMEDLRHFLAPTMKQKGIKINHKHYENN